MKWLSEPCDNWQIAICGLLFLLSGGFMWYQGVHKGYILLYLTMGVSMCLGMVATRFEWKYIGMFCALVLFASGGWLGLWTIQHMSGG